MPRLTGEQLRRAAATFPTATGLGCDNIAPRALGRLSNQALESLAEVLNLAEATGKWPEAFDLTLIVLLPKADGGLRPIGLFPTPIRLSMRARANIARDWEAHNQNTALYGGAGRGAQRAAWVAALDAETAALGKKQHAQALLDLVKAFEMIPHQKLIDAASGRGYPLRLLRLSLAAYRLQRAVGSRGIFASQVRATRGITAGSGFATTELRVLLIDLINLLQHKWPPRSGVQLL